MTEGSGGPGIEGEEIPTTADTGKQTASEKTPGILHGPMGGAFGGGLRGEVSSVREMHGLMQQGKKEDGDKGLTDPQEFTKRAEEATKVRNKLTGESTSGKTPGILQKPMTGAFKR